MKLKIYSIYDSKTEAYSQPYFLLNRGTFMRALLEAFNDSSSTFAKYPADFTAFEIGEWDDTNCEIRMHSAKINLGNLLEYSSLKTRESRERQESNAFADRIDEVIENQKQLGSAQAEERKQ